MPKTITITLLGFKAAEKGVRKPILDISATEEWSLDDMVGVTFSAYEKLAEDFLKTHGCSAGDDCPAVKMHKDILDGKDKAMDAMTKDK